MTLEYIQDAHFVCMEFSASEILDRCAVRQRAAGESVRVMSTFLLDFLKLVTLANTEQQAFSPSLCHCVFVCLCFSLIWRGMAKKDIQRETYSDFPSMHFKSICNISYCAKQNTAMLGFVLFVCLFYLNLYEPKSFYQNVIICSFLVKLSKTE